MGYTLEAVIARADLLGEVVRFTHGHVVPLAQGLALLPLTEPLIAEIDDECGEGAANFVRFPDGLMPYVREWSGRGPVAYVEADYFGGIGEQRAGIWRDGQRVAFFPERGAEPVSPISRALRWLGAERGSAYDEFEAVGLDRYRSTDDWLDAAPIPRHG